MQSILFDALRMLWFVSGAIGLVELLRFVQQRVVVLRRPWPEGLLFGGASTAVLATLYGALHLVDVKEIALVIPFLGMLAGAEGLIVGGLALTAALPEFALLALPTSAAGLLLLKLRRSPLPALLLAWLWIGLQGPLRAALQGHFLHPVVDILVSVLGAIALYVYVREVDRRHQELLRAEERSVTDALTGLLNRNGLADWLQGHPGAEGAALMIDLDDFKPINELYGHEGGDEVLREAARRLERCVRSGDALARLGGDEFLMLLPGVDRDGAVAVAERMLTALDRDDVLVEGSSIRLRASFGVAVGPLASCQEGADAALLRAKADGKARIVVAGDPEPYDDEEGQLLRVTSFARDLLFHMPAGVVVTGRSRRIVAASPGYEALTGVAQHLALGQKPHRLVGTDLTDADLLDNLAYSLEEDGRWRGELVNRRPGGELWWADYLMAAVEVRGRRLGYLGIVQDATEQHRHEAEILAEAISILSEAHDPTIEAHLRHVRRYTEVLVRAWQERYGRVELPWNPEEVGLAAILHDIGKTGLPPQVLTKPGPLSAEERRLVNAHPVIGARYLELLCARWCHGPGSHYMRLFLQVATTIARSHHERLDGSGYPEGLQGEAIPLLARLFAPVDVYDALRSERPYKRAWSEEAAFAYIEARQGREFDARVVELIAALRRQDDWCAVAGEEVA
jgi:putative two-component system response regulator